MTLIADETPAGPPDQISFERRPYNVRLLLAIDSRILESTSSKAILSDFESAAHRYAGDIWSLKTTEITWLSTNGSTALDRLDRSFQSKHFPGESADLWFVVVVESRTFGTRVVVRAWQPEIESESESVSIDVVDFREIPTAVLQVCRRLTKPIGIVEKVTDRTARILLRAGELTPPDHSFAQLSKGDLLIPVTVIRDKNKAIERVQAIPWTYLSVDTIDGSSITGSIQSGLRSALGGKKRNRTETLVVGIRPQHKSTKIELSTQSKPHRALVAHRIEVRSAPVIPRPTEQNPDANPAATLLHDLTTDRRGHVQIGVEPEHSLLWLFAFSGQNLLARVPFVPGTEELMHLEVPDDATRLSTEADLQMLQGEVIDAVALRNTSIVTIRSAAKKNDWQTVDQKLAILKIQRDSGSLQDRLTAVRVAGIAAAKAHKDKTAEARIIRMCDETTNLIEVHLSEEKLTQLTEEIENLRSAVSPAEKR